MAPVSRLNIVLGRTLGGATVALIQGALVFIVCLIAGFRVVHPLLLPLAIVFMVLIAVFCTAIGTVVGSVLQDMQGFQLIMNFIVLPLFFLLQRSVPAGRLGQTVADRRPAQSPDLRRRWVARRPEPRLRFRCLYRPRRARRAGGDPAYYWCLPLFADRTVTASGRTPAAEAVQEIAGFAVCKQCRLRTSRP